MFHTGILRWLLHGNTSITNIQTDRPTSSTLRKRRFILATVFYNIEMWTVTCLLHISPHIQAKLIPFIQLIDTHAPSEISAIGEYT